MSEHPDQAANTILRIVADWISEYYDTGGIGPDDLEWRLKQAGYPLPTEETTEDHQ